MLLFTEWTQGYTPHMQDGSLDGKMHFICRGNTFRSRLAEAYLQKQGWMNCSSSGIEATQNQNGHVTWYGQWIAKQEAIDPFLTPTWQQTTESLLIGSDRLVFLDQDIYQEASTRWSITRPIEVWQVHDVTGLPGELPFSLKEGNLLLKQAQQTWENLKRCLNLFLDRPDIRASHIDFSVDTATLRRFTSQGGD